MSNQRRIKAGRAALHAYAESRKLPAVERLQAYTISDAITDLLYYAASRKLDINTILLAGANGYTAEQPVQVQLAPSEQPENVTVSEPCDLAPWEDQDVASGTPLK